MHIDTPSRPFLTAATAWVLAAAVILTSPAALAQEEATAVAEPDEAPAAPADTHDLTVPRGATRAYLDACRAGDYDRAATMLNLPPDRLRSEGAMLARRLKVVLDRKLWVDLATLSIEPTGDADDDLPPGIDRIGGIETSRGTVDVLLQRVQAGERAVWRVGSGTIDQIPALYDEFGYGALGEFLPEPFFLIRVLEMELWQWLGLVIVVLLAWMAGWVAAHILRRLISPVVARTSTRLDDELLQASSQPLTMLLAVLAFHAMSGPLGMSVPVRAFLAGLVTVLAILAVIWTLTRLTDLLTERTRSRWTGEGRTAVVAVLPLARKALKVGLWILGALAILQNLGFQVTGLLAGLGIGGLAVALAAQKSLENLFGGLTLILDQPVRVGDFCRFGDKIGTVEDVGLRSTRVRTLDRTLVSIPNAEFANTQLENFAARDRIRLFLILNLRYETTGEQMRHVLAGLRQLLLAHPRITPDPARVRLIGFGAHSLDLEVFAYADTADWNEFLAIREDLFLRMMDVVEQSGTGFAFPSQTLYLGRDPGPDREAATHAEREVAAWRDAGRLPFPEFGDGEREQMTNTLDWPPRGSAVA
ncbi:MAG: mechanosensitive ion channel family protein [Planctomycetota bacterium]|jgi:MscS family membrane protein